MIEPLYGCDEAVAHFVDELTEGAGKGFGPSTALGFTKNNKLIAGFVYHNYHPESGVIEISGASTDRWATRATLKTMFGVPFDQYKVRMVVFRISENNTSAINAVKPTGACIYKIPELRGPDEAEVIMTLTAEKWRNSKFMKGHKNGQKTTICA